MNNINARLKEQKVQTTGTAEQDVFTFKRENGQWYVHLPVYLNQGWSKEDLQMVEGAHKFVNRISKGAQKVRLRLNTDPFTGSDVLQLVEHCTEPKGGAIYKFVQDGDSRSGLLFWICDLALFVFGDMPERIYVQRLPAKDKQQLKQDRQIEKNLSNMEGYNPGNFYKLI